MNETPNDTAPPINLPPVELPTTGFILQLFIIPAVIVAGLIVVVALFGKLADTHRDPVAYVEAIRTGSETVRWRKAHELANLIVTEPKLARDTKLQGAVTRLLEEELSRPETDAQLVQYLVLALGAFAAAGPNPEQGDAKHALIDAIDSKRPEVVRLAAAQSLATIAAAQAGGTWTDDEAIQALTTAAQDASPDLRQRAVFALGFLDGPTVLATLRQATNDADRFVRYNAANALARRGDEAATRVLHELLSSRELSEIHQAPTPEETRRRVEELHLIALAALEKAADSGHLDFVQGFRSDLDTLARSDLPAVRIQAQGLLKRLREPG